MDEINHEAISEAAADLETVYSLDYDRVEKVYYRLLEIGWFEPHFPSYSALDEAIHVAKACTPQDVLEEFENIDITRLSRYKALCDFLTDQSTPLYILEELSYLLGNFIEYYQQNKPHLIETGFPWADFPNSRWLNDLLAKLHPVKIPRYTDIVRSQRDYSYRSFARPDLNIPVEEGFKEKDPRFMTWVKEVPIYVNVDTPAFKGKALTYELGQDSGEMTYPFTPCSYSEAPYPRGLDSIMAQELERMRPRLWQVKIDVLRVLREKLVGPSKNAGAKELLNKCFSIITNSLNREDIDFLFSIEDFPTTDQPDAARIFSIRTETEQREANSLFGLFVLIGHCLNEVTVGTLNETAKAIRTSKIPNETRSYYETFGQPWRVELDRILDRLQDLNYHEKNHRDLYADIVDRELKNQRLTAELKSYKELDKVLSDYWESKKRHPKNLDQHCLTEQVAVTGVESTIVRGSGYIRSKSCGSVRVEGIGEESFTPTQAAALRIFFEHHEARLGEISQQWLLEQIDSNSKRLVDIFAGTKAWGKWIVLGERRGYYRLKF